MSQQPLHWSSKPSYSVIAAPLFFLLGCTPLFITDIFPFIDFYNHVARYYILANYDQLDRIREYYVPNWQLFPNIGLDLIAVQLFRFLPADLGSKTVIALIFLIQYSGALFLQHSMAGRISLLSIVALPLLFFSYVLTWGFASFLLGLGFSFWCLGTWFLLRNRRPRLAIGLTSVLAVALYFIHGLAFFLYGLVLFAFEFQDWLGSNPRKWSSLLRQTGQISIQAILPILLFASSPTAQNAQVITDSFSNLAFHAQAGRLWDRLYLEASHRLEVIFRVMESPFEWLDVATFLILIAIFFIALRYRLVEINRRFYVPLCLVAGLYVIMPPNLFGTGYLPERLPLLFACLLIASVKLEEPLRKPSLAVLAVVFSVLLSRTAALAIGLGGFSATYEAFLEDSQKIPEGARVKNVAVYEFDQRNEIQPTCRILEGLLVPARQAVVPLFAYGTQQPIAKTELYLRELEQLPKIPDVRFREIGTFFDDYLQRIERDTKYEYLVLCNGQKLVNPLPEWLTLIAERKDSYAIYKIARKNPSPDQDTQM